jgi:hypothetical protein
VKFLDFFHFHFQKLLFVADTVFFSSAVSTSGTRRYSVRATYVRSRLVLSLVPLYAVRDIFPRWKFPFFASLENFVDVIKF